MTVTVTVMQASWCSSTGVALRKDSADFRKGFTHWPPLPTAFLDGAICNASEPAECTADNYDEPLLHERARAAEALAGHTKAGVKVSRSGREQAAHGHATGRPLPPSAARAKRGGSVRQKVSRK